MLNCVFHGPGKPFEIRRDLLPPLGDGEVLVAITLATICGSDLHTHHGLRTEPTPSVLGHEGVGIVLASNNPSTRIGDKITWSIANTCGGLCKFCRPGGYGLPQKCERLMKYGHSKDVASGCYSSHILLRKGTKIVQIPKGLPDALTAPINCAFATVVACIRRAIRIFEGGPPPSTAVVQGAGLLGIYACISLLYYKFSKVCVSDVVPARIQLSKEFGSQGESVEDGTADFVLEVCGVPQVVPNGIKALRVGGVYSLAGLVHPRSVLVGVTGEAIIRKCLTLQGTHNYDDESLEEAIRILNWAHTEKKFPLEKLVSSPIPLEKLDSAFVEAATQKWMRVSVIPPTQISKL